MDETANQLVQPLTFRMWDPKYRSFFYTDARPEASELVDRWTGLFDKQGLALYENDIIQAHFDWKLGWVRALIVRDQKRQTYSARATAPDGTSLQIGCFCFADAYRIGNLREHPRKLVAATEQFPASQEGPWWVSRAVFRTLPTSCRN